MKIRLLAPDSKIPNYAIMKISAWHKAVGDNVDWYSPLMGYADTDVLYISKVFAFTDDVEETTPMPINAMIIKGGTGYDINSKLPTAIENSGLDYSIYPDCDYSIIFTTRGCVRNCPFCVVPKAEGKIHNVSIPNLNPNGKYIKLLDNNFFANPTWRENLQELRSFNQPIDFNQGIDLRLFTEEQGEALKTVKIKGVHCSWDNYKDKEKILPKLGMLCKYVKPYLITVYVLVGFESYEITETDIERVETLREYGVNPFAMGYRDLTNKDYKVSNSVKAFCRWVNRKELFKSCAWEEYE